MLIENEYGTINITDEVITGIVANHSYGVHGMASKNKLGELVQLFKKDPSHKGIKIEIVENALVNIELHIVVRYGVNITAAAESITGEVRYNVEEMTGMKVGKVDVFVDSIMAD